MKREVIKLTSEEREAFRKLKPNQGEALNFWFKVALARGLDYKTFMYEDGYVSGLPWGHGKYWCWPSDLKCRQKPRYNEREEE
jgi:hypothetical protein